jgi:hypothetical protein
MLFTVVIGKSRIAQSSINKQSYRYQTFIHIPLRRNFYKAFSVPMQMGIIVPRYMNRLKNILRAFISACFCPSLRCMGTRQNSCYVSVAYESAIVCPHLHLHAHMELLSCRCFTL